MSLWNRDDSLLTGLLTRYGIFKRTINLPLFHPYYINYGRNKEDFYRVLNTMDYHYYVMTVDFIIDLPHPKYDRNNMTNL